LKKGYDRNYWAMVLEGTMFHGGIVVFSTGGVVALFVNTMTGSNTLIGLAVTLQGLCIILGQLISAPYVNTIRKLPQFLYKSMGVQRIIPLLIALPLFIGASGYISVIAFMVLFASFWFYDGVITLPWGEMCARALKPELRGHMMGIQATIGGALSLLVGLVIAWLLATPTLSDNDRFGLIFVLGSVLLLTSVIFIRLVKDPKPIIDIEKVSIKKFYSQIPFIIKKNKPLQLVLIARIPSYIGFAAISFVVVFGKNAIHLSDTQISWLVYAGIIGGILSGIILGEASRHYGNKAIILLSNFAVIVSLCMAVSMTYFQNLGYIWLFITCIIASFSANHWIGYFNYFIDIAPVEKRSEFQLIGQAVGIPFSFAGLIMGAIVDRFGYITMFIICVVFAIITVLLSLPLLSKNKVAELSATK